jgi:hypothetical protein
VKSFNSAIFEGVVQSALSLDGKGKNRRCFVVVSSRHTVVRKGRADLVVLDDAIRVEFRSPLLIRMAQREARIGREVRVVGSIHRSKVDNDVYIAAESAVYRPMFYAAEDEDL